MHTASELSLEFNFHCAASPATPTATFQWKTTLTDADGVVTNVIQHSSTCTSTGLGSRAASSNSEKPTAYIRSEEHTSELQSLMRISYAVFCLKKKKT